MRHQSETSVAERWSTTTRIPFERQLEIPPVLRNFRCLPRCPFVIPNFLRNFGSRGWGRDASRQAGEDSHDAAREGQDAQGPRRLPLALIPSRLGNTGTPSACRLRSTSCLAPIGPGRTLSERTGSRSKRSFLRLQSLKRRFCSRTSASVVLGSTRKVNVDPFSVESSSGGL